MESTSIEPHVFMDSMSLSQEGCVEIHLESIFFKAGASTVLLGDYLTTAEGCIWCADQIKLSSIAVKTGKETNYMSIGLMYEDVQRIDYYVGNYYLKMFVMAKQSTMDAIRGILDTNDVNDKIRFSFESEELIERYLTVFFNKTDKSKVFLQWLDRIVAKVNPKFKLNRINFDLSIGVVLDEELNKVKNELAQAKIDRERLLTEFNRLTVDSYCGQG